MTMPSREPPAPDPAPSPAPHPRTVADALAARFPNSSRSTLKRMVLAGRVMRNGKPVKKLTEAVRGSDRIDVLDKPKPPSPIESLKPLDLIFEDPDLLIVHKPANLLTSTTPREKRATALALVQRYLVATNPESRAGLIHRLDRDASGLLVFSKTDLAYESLKTQFFKHTVERLYRAAVHGVPCPPKARIESRLVEYADGTVHSTKTPLKGQLAITEYELLRTHNKVSELRIRLETGRKHQIRVHLAGRNHPILGDKAYGRRDSAPRLMLAATDLHLDHPRTGERLEFHHPPPAELDSLFL